MKRERNPELKRKKIIEATHQILREGGYFTNFSLDKVAEMAGVSKGGLMHHFESKGALLRAAAQDTIDQFEARVEAEMTVGNDQEAGLMTRAYVETVLGANRPFHTEISPLLLSYVNEGEDQPKPSRFESWQARTEEDGLDVVTATMVRLIADGILYTELIDKTPIPAELREQLYARVQQLLGDG
ncbi:MAG: TetR/AcrR family transcriptional regulator [Chloroflexota bacterium]